VENLPDRAELLAGLRTLSKEMLDSAKAGEWEAVVKQEAQRYSLLDTLFAQPAPPTVVAAIAACIREVLASDNTVLALAREARGKLVQQLVHLAQGRKACLAYERLP
jgi:hypothetical protein